MTGLHRALWLSSRWLIFTHAKESFLLYFLSSPRLCPRSSVHIWFTSFVSLPKPASSGIRALSAWQASLPRSALLISWFHTRLHCLQWHTSRISRTDLNASWHADSPKTVYLLMPDTVGCLHRPQSNNPSYQPTRERWLLQHHAVPIEVWRQVWWKRCEGWWRNKIISLAEIRINGCAALSGCWSWSRNSSGGRGSTLNRTPQSFSTNKIASRKAWRLRFWPRPRSEQDDVNGSEHPTRA